MRRAAERLDSGTSARYPVLVWVRRGGGMRGGGRREGGEGEVEGGRGEMGGGGGRGGGERGGRRGRVSGATCGGESRSGAAFLNFHKLGRLGPPS